MIWLNFALRFLQLIAAPSWSFPIGLDNLTLQTVGKRYHTPGCIVSYFPPIFYFPIYYPDFLSFSSVSNCFLSIFLKFARTGETGLRPRLEPPNASNLGLQTQRLTDYANETRQKIVIHKYL